MSRACQDSEPRRDSRVAIAAVVWAVLFALPVACSRRALAEDAGGTGHVGADGGADLMADVGIEAAATEIGLDVSADEASADDASADGDGSAIPCGTLTCTGTDLCVEYAGCGGPLDCLDQTDAGGCPPGWHDNRNCASGCERDCPPPTFECVPLPAACTGKPNCSCLGPTFCTFGSCQGVQGRLAECAAA